MPFIASRKNAFAGSNIPSLAKSKIDCFICFYPQHDTGKPSGR